MAAKKRKAPSAAKQESKGFEDRGGKMGPITSYEDIADSDDEFHMQRDKIMLDEGPDAKRRRKWAEEGLYSYNILLNVQMLTIHRRRT